MDIVRCASAGTLESSDAYVEIGPGRGALEIALESKVLEQFGQEIEAEVKAVLEKLDVKSANVRVVDQGALSCVLRARVEAAVLRGKGEA